MSNKKRHPTACLTCPRKSFKYGLCKQCLKVRRAIPKQKHRIRGQRREPYPLGNDPNWRSLSRRFLVDNPICARCQRSGRPRPANLVDHILPVRYYPDKSFDTSNLQSLCKPCHSTKSGHERRSFLAYDYSTGVVYDFSERVTDGED